MNFLTKFDKIFVYRADDEDDYVPDNRYSRGGAEKVILPTAPRASLGSAIDSDRIPNVSTGYGIIGYGVSSPGIQN